MKKDTIKMIFLLSVVFLAYSNTLFFKEFIWDDDTLIVHNDRLKNIKNIPSLFVPYPREPYRPLRYVSFAFDHFLFGLRPSFYHLGNLLLHILNVFLVFKILTLFFKSREISFFSALIFGIYPAWNEAVVWIKNRSDLLACLFFLLAFYFFMKQKNIISMLSFALSLLSKEIALAFPLVITLYVFLFTPLSDKLHVFPFDKGRLRGIKDLKRTIPFWVLAFLWGIFLLIIYKGGGVQRYVPGAGIFFSLKILFKFFLILIFPFTLNAERNVSLPKSVFDGEVIAAFLILILAVFVLFKIRKKEITFAILWVILNLLPTANPGVVAGRPLAEHRLYIPGIGFALFLGLIFQRRRKIVLYALLPLFFITTFKRNFDWKDGYTFWKATTKVAPYSARAWAALGIAEMARGNVSKAEEYLRKALAINPHSDDAVNALLNILIDSGRLDEAEKEALKFLEARPKVFVVYNRLMDVYLLQGKEEKAKEVCQKELTLLSEFGSEDKGDYNAIMPYCYRLGFIDELESLYLKAERQKIANSLIYANLGTHYYLKKDFEKAVLYYKKAAKIDPKNSFIYYNLANTYDDMGELEKSIEYFRKAIKYEPKNSSAWYNLGLVFEKKGDYKEAANCFSKVLELEPGNQEVVKKLAEVGGEK